jgi:hypothetical protein
MVVSSKQELIAFLLTVNISLSSWTVGQRYTGSPIITTLHFFDHDTHQGFEVRLHNVDEMPDDW